MPFAFEIQETPIDPAVLRARLARVDAGGFVCFEGWVRDHHKGRAVVALAYEAYRTLAESEGARILAEVSAEHAVLGCVAVHRVGALVPGDLAVWVGVVAAHRDAAFVGCRRIIDETKARVPIWKHERYADGTELWVNSEEK